jgi:hypothetical protein
MPSHPVSKQTRLRQLSVALAIAAIAMTGCGGGGWSGTALAPAGGAPAPPPFQVPTQQPTTPPAATATVTPLGTPEGFPVVETVGPAGGTVSCAAGRPELVIPAGVLAAPTDITIQPITNTMPNGIGQAYRLGPEGLTFAVPVKISFNPISDELNGSDPGFVSLPSQAAEDTWEAYPTQVADVANGSISVDSLHFSEWGANPHYTLVPRSAVANVHEQFTLTLSECGNIDTPKPLVRDPQTGQLSSGCTYKALVCRGASTALLDQWKLDGNAIAVSPASLGTLVPTNSARAGYKAPDKVPNASLVVASARLQAEGQTATPRLNSAIRIIDQPGYRFYAERKQILTNAVLGRQEISSVASGRWLQCGTRSSNNKANTWFPIGNVNIAYKVVNFDCTVNLRGSADFDETLEFNSLVLKPVIAQFSVGASVLQVRLTGTSECKDSGTQPLSLTIQWVELASANQNPASGLVTSDTKGQLTDSNRWSPQKGEVVGQTSGSSRTSPHQVRAQQHHRDVIDRLRACAR